MPISIQRPYHVTHMSPSYIYASTLVNTRKLELLDDTQIEMLLTAKTFDELVLALQGTYLASHLKGTTSNDIFKALEESVRGTRTLLSGVAPDPELLDILWIKYDFYNIRAIVKGIRQEKSDDDIIGQCFNLGLIEPEKMLNAYKNNTLHTINPYFAQTAQSIEKQIEAEKIEHMIHVFYFKAISEMASMSRNSFLQRYVSVLIDLFNTIAIPRLSARLAHSPESTTIFIPGGTLTETDISKNDNLIDLFKNIGGERVWKEAVNDYLETKNFTLLEKTSDQYLLRFLERESFELFSLAPLYTYFTAIKNNAQTIRAIVVGKLTGMSEYDVRFNIRRLK